MKKKITLAVVLINIFILSYSQKGYDRGYIVTSKFDTLRGFIKTQSNYMNSRLCEFIKGGDSESRKYTPEDLISYRITDKKYYVSKEVKVDSVPLKLFLEYLVHGIADLYYLKEQKQEYYFLDKDNQMVQLNNDGKVITRVENQGKSDEKIMTFYKPSLQYKRMMTVLFQDIPELQKRINNLNYDYRSLINITVDYHNAVCPDKECIDYTKQATQSIFIEPWAGYRMETMSLKKSSDHAKSSSVGFGINLRLKPFKGYSKWDFITGLAVVQSSFSKDFFSSIYAVANPNQQFDYLLKAKYVSLMLPLTGEYTFTDGKIRPYASVSLINFFFLNPEVSSVRVTYTDMMQQHFDKYNLGGSFGFGIRFAASEKFYLVFRNELGYRKVLSDEGFIFDLTHVSWFMTGIGIGFRVK
jgi:hypothetical protein